MKQIISFVIFIFCFSIISIQAQTEAIRINQLGYYPASNKIAVVVFCPSSTFEIIDLKDNSVAFTGNLSAKKYWTDAGDSVKNCDFSALTTEGRYKIRIPDFGESYAFVISDTVYRFASYASLKTFYYQRCSYALTAPYAGLWTRAAGHSDNAVILHSSTGKTGTISSPKGWYDAGDYGKYVINAGISIATLLSFYENFPTFFADGTLNIPESGNAKNDLLDEVKFELDWLKTMQDNDGGVFFKLTTLNFSGFVMPSADYASRYAIGKSTTSALDFAAMMAMAGRIYKDYDADYASDCITRAEKAWNWAKAHPAVYFTNPSDVSTGEYGDSNASDEFIWAAAELYISTAKEEYKTYLETRSSSLNYNSSPGWGSVQPLASLSLATQANGLSSTILSNIKNSILTTANTWLSQISSAPCRIPTFGYYWGSNSDLANKGIGLLYAYLISNDTKYIKGAAECADYLLGKNATGFSFVTGYGSKTPMYQHHRPSASDGIVQPIPGFLSGGANSGKQDNEVYPFSNAAKCFVDVVGSYASNEVAINWNSPLTALLAGVDAVLGNSSEMKLPINKIANNPPSIYISSPIYNANLPNDVLSIKTSISDADGISKAELYLDNHFYGAITTSPYNWVVSDLKVGSHTITVSAMDNTGLAYSKTNVFSLYQVHAAPGLVEAEKYMTMSGISLQTTADVNGGQNVTSLDANDYLDYSINVSESGQYVVEYRVASSTGNAAFELRKSNGSTLSMQTVARTGGTQKWITISDTVYLNAGKQTLRIYTTSAGFNLNWINFTKLIPSSVNDNLGESKRWLQILPNIVDNELNISFNLKENSPVEFRIHSVDGKLIDVLKYSNTSTVSGTFSWNLNSKLKSGIYLLSMWQNNKKIELEKFFIN